MPNGVLNVVTGYGATAGARSASHPDVRKLAFTGSVPTGISVASAAVRDVKSISLELGGKSPIVVFDDADIEQAVEWVMFGIFWNQGQVCMRDLADDRRKRHRAEAHRSSFGGSQEDHDWRRHGAGHSAWPLVSKPQYDKVLNYIDVGKSEATLVTGGTRPAATQRRLLPGADDFRRCPADRAHLERRIIRPCARCRERSTRKTEAVALANDSEFGLAAAVMSGDHKRAERIADAFEAGIVWINCSQPNFLEPPWGGVKKSGVGRELGTWGLNNFLEPEADHDLSDPRSFGVGI